MGRNGNYSAGEIIGKSILVIGAMALYIYVVMRMWNWLMPDLFGLKEIDYLHTLGLLALVKLVFLGHGWHSYKDKDHGHDRERWKKKFRGKWKDFECKLDVDKESIEGKEE